MVSDIYAPGPPRSPHVCFTSLPFLGFLLLGLFTYSLRAVDYFSAVPGDLGDARFNSVILEHLFQWVTGHADNLWSPSFFYPYEGALAFSDNHFGSVAPYILLRSLGAGREMAYDGWFLIGCLLTYVATYAALPRLGISLLGAAAGAFVFTFALPVLAQEGHAQLIYRFAVPLAYVAFVARLMLRLDFVSLKASNWFTYAGAPAVANAGLLVAGAGLIAEKSFAPYAAAGAIMMLLFIGILDAWDLTLWIIGNHKMAQQAKPDGQRR